MHVGEVEEWADRPPRPGGCTWSQDQLTPLSLPASRSGSRAGARRRGARLGRQESETRGPQQQVRSCRTRRTPSLAHVRTCGKEAHVVGWEGRGGGGQRRRRPALLPQGIPKLIVGKKAGEDAASATCGGHCESRVLGPPVSPVPRLVCQLAVIVPTLWQGPSWWLS